jgi:hypothetical protein
MTLSRRRVSRSEETGREQRLGAVLPAVLARAAAVHRPLRAIQEQWPRVVGKSLAAHTRPVGLRRGQLIVQTDRPGDGFALRYTKTVVLQRLHALAAGKAVEEIIVRPGAF